MAENRRPRLVCGVLSAVLIAGTAGCGTNHTPTRLPIGNLETPQPNTPVTGPVRVSGWALSESGIDRVDVYVDRNLATSGSPAISRADVQKTYPNFPDSAKAGFDLQLDLSARPAGIHELVVQVRTKDDAVKEFPTVPISISR